MKYYRHNKINDNDVNNTLSNIKTTIQNTTAFLVNYWYNDLPPSYGPLRFTFYSFYFLITYYNKWYLFHSRPTRETFFYEPCVEALNESIPNYNQLGYQYKAEGGLFNYFALEYFLSCDAPSLCSLLTNMFWYGLVLSAIGLGGKIPRYATAIAFWILFGIRNARFVGESSHSHYLAGMAMTALCFAENNLIDNWSIDSLLHKIYKRNCEKRRHNIGVPEVPLSLNGQQQRQPQHPSKTTCYVPYGPSAGSAARKFVLYMSVCSIFFAGMHKFSTWGFKWMDGQTLFWCINHEHSHWKALNRFFRHHPPLSVLLSIATVVGEIGAFAVLVYPKWRPYGILTFYGFHIGVFLLMQPNFISNEVTYILIMDWRQVYYGIKYCFIQTMNRSNSNNDGYDIKYNKHDKARIIIRSSTMTTATVDGISLSSSSSSFMSSCPLSWKIGAWMYSIIAIIVFITSICRIDAFPFFSW
jgi:hypothetical protein